MESKGHSAFIFCISLICFVSIFFSGCSDGIDQGFLSGPAGDSVTSTGSTDGKSNPGLYSAGSISSGITYEKALNSISSSLYNVKFIAASDWGSGFVGNIDVSYMGQNRLNNWRIEFDFDKNISSIWNARIQSHQGNHYVITGESYNSWIDPGKTVSFGFQGIPGAVVNKPSNYTLHGEAPASSASGSSGSITAVYKTVSDWGSGFTGNITVINKGTGNIIQWNIEFDFDANITGIWNARILSHTGSHYKIAPESYNQTIPANSQVDFGFNGTPGNVSTGPGNITINVSGGITPSPSPPPSPASSPSPTPLPSPVITPSPGPNPTPQPTPYTGNYRVVAYFTNWGIYDRNYQVTDIPAAKITHINYAFFAIDSSTGTCKMTDSWADIEKVFTGATAKGFPDQTWEQSARGEAGNLGRLRQLKELYPNIKTLMSIGGWTLSYNFPEIAKTDAARKTFVTSCMGLLKRYDFDGIDLDWEYPGPQDKLNFTSLLAEFRKQLDFLGQNNNRHYLLSFAGPAGYDKLINIELGKIGSYLDYINVMTYDFHGGWENVTNHLSPLYMNPADPANSTDRMMLNIDWAVSYYINAGFPPEKLGIGIPLYGRAWEQVSASNNGLFQQSSSFPATNLPGNWESGVLDYWKIRELISNASSYTRYFDSSSKVPWVYGKNLSANKTNGGMFVTYDDTESLSIKVQYLKSKGLGGLMFWEFSGDVKNSDAPDSLISRAIVELKK